MNLTYTTHAEAMMAERGIERVWVEQTLLAPETTEPDPQHPERVRAFMAVPERGGRVLRVVYEQSDLTYRVITLFLDRSRSRRR